jgi:hypothetical protein
MHLAAMLGAMSDAVASATTNPGTNVNAIPATATYIGCHHNHRNKMKIRLKMCIKNVQQQNQTTTVPTKIV